jgi:hypothetical protein
MPSAEVPLIRAMARQEVWADIASYYGAKIKD